MISSSRAFHKNENLPMMYRYSSSRAHGRSRGHRPCAFLPVVEQLEDRTMPSVTMNVAVSGPATALAGTNVTLMVTLGSMGPSAGQGVSLTDTLPSGTTFVSQTQTSGPTFTQTQNGGTIADTIATMPAGTLAAFNIVVGIPANTSSNATLVDQALVSATSPLSSSSVTSASASTTVVSTLFPSSSLGWVIDADPFSVNADPGWITYVAVDTAGNTYLAAGGQGVVKYNADETLAWARAFGSPQALAIDGSGNVLVTGSFSGTIHLDSVTLTSQGTGNDAFVIRLDASGTALWGRQFGGPYDFDTGTAVTTDAAGNVYVTGRVNLTAGDLNNIMDVFAAKLDAATGNTVWYKQVGGSSIDSGTGISLDHAGNVLVCGSFIGSTDFDPGAGTYKLSSGGRSVQPASAAFILKLNNAGNFVWADAFQASNGSGSGAYNLAVDASNNVYVAGSFTGTVDFNPGNGKLTLPNAGGSDVYVAKLTSAGALIWAESMGGTDNDGQYGGLALDAAGNVYVTGNFGSPTANFGSFTLTNNSTNAGGWDIYVTKLDTNGNFLWAVSAGGTGDDMADGIAVDNSGNIYLVGLYHNTVDFDPGTGTDYLTSSSDRSSFLWKLTQN
jgi:uncharacterized repeat protein (TIGR01451 family)